MARQMITCQSCGKRYDYLESESCPHCGAFNYVKNGKQHICGADDVESIIEMKHSGHEDGEPLEVGDSGIDRGLQQKYARARAKLDRLETTEDVFRTSFGSKKYPRPAKQDRSKKNSGCLKPLIVVIVIIVLLNIILPLFFGLMQHLMDAQDYPDPTYSESPAYESEVTYKDGVPGYSYSVGDMDFTVGDMAILDTGDVLGPDQAVVLVRVDASCSLPEDDYADTAFYPYLTDPDYLYYFPVLNVVSPEDEELIQQLFGNASYSMLQEFEISYMDGGAKATGYLPFLVDLGEDGAILPDLTFNLQVDYYEVQSGVYRGETICYTFPLNVTQTISPEDAAAAYYNSTYY